MSGSEPGPRYYYNDPSGTPYHDPSWYSGKKDDDDDKKEEEIFQQKSEFAFNFAKLERALDLNKS